MLRFSENISDTPVVRGRGVWDWLGVRMPVAHEVKSFNVHRINLALLLASVRYVMMPETQVRRPRTSRSFDDNIAFRESREQLPAGLERMGIQLLIFCEMIQD
jgi:hypothetical protein